MTVSLARFVKRGNGPEDRRMICTARNEAEGRSRSAAERGGRERSEDGAVHPTAHKLGSLCLGRASAALGTVSHGASRIRKALRKPGFPLRWVRRRRFLRLRPGKKHLPSKSPKPPLRSETVIFDKCVLGNLAFHRQFREIQMMTWEEIAELLMSTAQMIAPVVPREIRAPFGVCRALL